MAAHVTWGEVLATLLGGLGGLYHKLHDIKNSYDLREVMYEAYVHGDPLVAAVAVALLLSIIVFAISLPTHKHSWVDKLWSIIPIAYLWHFVAHDEIKAPDGQVSPRLVILALLVTVWGARLTYNFWRKGGYRWDEEDYRWPILRARVHPALFQAFNLTFIALTQNLLLLAITAPAYLAWRCRNTPLNWVDAAATLLNAAFIALEAVADQQQWVFQTAKHKKKAEGKRLTGDYHKGFLTQGLFRYSRHPNFFAEQAIWWSVYLFSVAACGEWINWSMAGALALTALFQGSTWLTESLTAAKYPKYREYQQTTSRLVPWPPLSEKPKGTRGARKQQRQPEEHATPKTPATPRGRRKSAAGTSDADATPATRGGARSRSRRRQSEGGAGKSDGEGTTSARRARSRSRAKGEATTPRRRSTRSD